MKKVMFILLIAIQAEFGFSQNFGDAWRIDKGKKTTLWGNEK